MVTTFIPCENGNETFYLISILLSINISIPNIKAKDPVGMHNDRCDIMHPKNTKTSVNTQNSEVHKAGINAFKKVMNLQKLCEQNI